MCYPLSLKSINLSRIMLYAKIPKICNNQFMRNLFISIVLVLVGLQTSFAAVASYCDHEQVSSSHPGHHQHEHQKAPEKSDSGKSLDADCGVCHLAHTPFFANSSGTAFNQQDFTFALVGNQLLSSPILPQPEKPNWTHLA